MLRSSRRRKGQLTMVLDSSSGDGSREASPAILNGQEKQTVDENGSEEARTKRIPLQNLETNGNEENQLQRKSERERVNTRKFYGAAPKQIIRKNRLILSDDEDDEDQEPKINFREQPRRIKIIPVPDEDDVIDVENDFQSKLRKRRAKQPESGSDSWSESESSDSDYEEDAKWRRKFSGYKLGEGERKSGRVPREQTEKNDMTDREFEKMMTIKEKELPASQKKKVKKEKKKKKAGIKDVRKMARNSDSFKENDSSRDDDSFKENGEINSEYCAVCQDGGEILLCDRCPRSFHKECARLEIIPEGDWACPRCTGSMSDSDESYSGHEHRCRVCRSGGEVLLCDYCQCVFHLDCLNPPLTECPEEDWKCPRCVTSEKPLRGWVQSIITWRWSNQDQNYDELDHTRSPMKKKTERLKRELAAQNRGDGQQKKPERLMFVRFKDYSYWECEWVTEQQMEVFHPQTLMGFKRRFDQEEPPALEDGSSFGAIRHHTNKVDDPYRLEERFYKWGIKPSWLQIHRVINHDTDGDRKIYLVKWQDLGYEYATWEDLRKAPEGLEDFEKHIEEYWKRRNRRTKAENEKGSKAKPKKSLLKKKWDAQPSYLSEKGGTLHPYQLEGLNWLRFSYSQDTNTILADEMGLGKTIQAISFLYVLWKEGYTKGPFLVSAPLSTVPNWEREFQFWAPEMYVLSYSGSKETRQIIRENEFSYQKGAFATTSAPGRFSKGHTPKFDVLLTSYEMVSTDKTTFTSINWDVIVIDEAHRLRSNHSLFFKTLCDYKVNYKLLLTGTPLQNNLEELFHLLNFLEPGKFDDMDNFLDLFSEISKEDQVQKLHEMLAPHMLRRMKIDVLKDIPPKSEFLVRVELSPMQKKFYKHILTKNFEALNVKGYGKQTSLMNIMMDLRKCCNHPYLFPTAEKDAQLTKTGQYEVEALIKGCGKLDLLAKMLKKLREENHRVLVFSQMTRVLDILEDFMSGLGYGYERIDGSIMGNMRQAAIDRFNSKESDSFVFLLSTKAGGLGINLATADTVIIFDMDWNPHNDIQAFSRAHRIGQKNKVMIYRFVSRSTVEERMAQVCKEKMMLTELVIQRNMGSEKTESLTKKEVSDILRFGAEDLFKDSGKTKAIVYDDEAVRKLLDRSQESEVVEEQEKEFGLNEYLRSFKVASYQVKEGAETEGVPEGEDSPKAADTPAEKDADYWNRVLGQSYEEHRAKLLKEQEELAASLGKGKRIRRKVNYYEKFVSPEKKVKRLSLSAGDEPEDDDEYKPDSGTDSATDFSDEEGDNGTGPKPGGQDDVEEEDITDSADLDNWYLKWLERQEREKKRRAKLMMNGENLSGADMDVSLNPGDAGVDELPSPPLRSKGCDCGFCSPKIIPTSYELNQSGSSEGEDVPLSVVQQNLPKQKKNKPNLDLIGKRLKKLEKAYPHIARFVLYRKLQERGYGFKKTMKYLKKTEGPPIVAAKANGNKAAPPSSTVTTVTDKISLPNSAVSSQSSQRYATVEEATPSPPKRFKKGLDFNNEVKSSECDCPACARKKVLTDLVKSGATPKGSPKALVKGPQKLERLMRDIDEIDDELSALEKAFPNLRKGVHQQELEDMSQQIDETMGSILTEIKVDPWDRKKNFMGSSDVGVLKAALESPSTSREDTLVASPGQSKAKQIGAILRYLESKTKITPSNSQGEVATPKTSKGIISSLLSAIATPNKDNLALPSTSKENAITAEKAVTESESTDVKMTPSQGKKDGTILAFLESKKSASPSVSKENKDVLKSENVIPKDPKLSADLPKLNESVVSSQSGPLTPVSSVDDIQLSILNGGHWSLEENTAVRVWFKDFINGAKVGTPITAQVIADFRKEHPCLLRTNAQIAKKVKKLKKNFKLKLNKDK